MQNEMKKYFDSMAVLLASAWVGGMWTAGYIVAPVLFQSLPDRALAGMLAGRIFGVIAYLGMVCAVYLLIYLYSVRGKQVLRHSTFWLIAVMLLFTLLGQFALQPLLAQLKAQALPLYVMDSPYADSFRFWHGTASIIYLLQSLSGAILLLKGYRVRE